MQDPNWRRRVFRHRELPPGRDIWMSGGLSAAVLTREGGGGVLRPSDRSTTHRDSPSSPPSVPVRTAGGYSPYRQTHSPPSSLHAVAPASPASASPYRPAPTLVPSTEATEAFAFASPKPKQSVRVGVGSRAGFTQPASARPGSAVTARPKTTVPARPGSAHADTLARSR